MSNIAIIVAAGEGKRFGGEIPKQFRLLNEMPLLSRTISRFEGAQLVDEIAVVVSEEHLLYTREKIVQPFGFKKVNRIVAGGASRQESVYRGLKSLPFATSLVAVHDGVRPMVRSSDIDRVIALAQKERAAILARAITETVKRVEGDFIISTLDRARLYLAETPQAFQYDIIMSAHGQAADKASASDDATLVEALGFKVKTVVPEYPNIKVTTARDLDYVKFLLEKENET